LFVFENPLSFKIAGVAVKKYAFNVCLHKRQAQLMGKIVLPAFRHAD